MLRKFNLTPLTTNEIVPTGWLKRQLEIQAAGLSGNLDKVWPDVSQSRWIGGDKEGWERVPYWLDGFIPLAYLLNDEDLKVRAKKYIDAIIAGQKEDGWICPCTDEERKNYDVWAMFLISKVLVLYHDCCQDERIEEVLYKAMKNLDAHTDRNTLFDWSATRWYECLIPLYWLYERRPEKWLLYLALKLYAQGTDYKKIFDHWVFQTPHPKGRWTFLTHVVNLAMCLKSEAEISRQLGTDPNAFAKQALETLLRDHGMTVGHFTGDECLSGTSPIQGSECCSVTEAMYSYERLLAISGDPFWADRLENLAFNALPATLSPDMWTHQYDQMTNQVQCGIFEREHTVFRTNGCESILFGLEPNYGCCTANFNQGFPKFALSTFMKTEKGLAATVLAPSIVNTELNGTQVTIETKTNYPFRDQVSFLVTTDKPVAFPFSIRIPSFASSAQVDGKAVTPGEFFTIDKNWEGQESIQLELCFEIELVKRPSGLYALRRGPLLYSLKLAENWRKLEYERNGVERKFPYCDYEIFPESKWNYAFANQKFEVHQDDSLLPFFAELDEKNENSDEALEVNANKPGIYVFSPEGAPISIKVTMVEISWRFEHGVCHETPDSLTPLSEPVELSFIPYGCTNLRITEMPVIYQ